MPRTYYDEIPSQTLARAFLMLEKANQQGVFKNLLLSQEQQFACGGIKKKTKHSYKAQKMANYALKQLNKLLHGQVPLLDGTRTPAKKQITSMLLMSRDYIEASGISLKEPSVDDKPEEDDDEDEEEEEEEEEQEEEEEEEEEDEKEDNEDEVQEAEEEDKADEEYKENNDEDSDDDNANKSDEDEESGEESDEENSDDEGESEAWDNIFCIF